MGFNRLLRDIDLLIARGKLSPRVFAQIGASSYVPRNCPSARFLPHQELVQAIRQCDLVITHDGTAAIGESVRAGKPTVVVSRRFDEGELLYRSRAELAHHLAHLGWIRLIDDISELPRVLAAPVAPVINVNDPDSSEAPEVLVKFISALEPRCHGRFAFSTGM
jgi:UDP-N-acetylglucosamine transferase subunit ALG13